ncbi:hypothetical protein ScPMuIL_010599 [Solemya velum]
MQFPKKLGHLLVKYGKLHCLKNPRSRAGSQSFCRLRYQKHMMRYGAIRFFSTYSRHHLLGVGPSCMSVKGPVRMVETLCGEKGTSALFVSGSEQRTSEVDIDLDLAQQMASVDELKKNVRLRGLEMDVDALAEKYRGYQRLQTVKLKLEEERTDIAKRMAALVKVKQTEDITNSREVLMKRGKEIKVELRDLMTEWWQIEEEVMFTALKLPNDLHSDSVRYPTTFIQMVPHAVTANTWSSQHVVVTLVLDLDMAKQLKLFEVGIKSDAANETGKSGKGRKQSQASYESAKRSRVFVKSWEEKYPGIFEGDAGKLYCKPCTEFPTISDPKSSLVLGTSSYRTSSLEGHWQSKQHLLAASRFCEVERERQGQPIQGPMDRALRALSESNKNIMLKLFNTVYFILKYEEPFTALPRLLSLQIKNGSELGKLLSYRSDQACRRLCKVIANDIREQC